VALQPKCPVIMHFGERDAHIPMTQVDQVWAAHPGVPIHVYAADHGFNCDHRGSFDAAAAQLAYQRTLAFMAKHLG
jgi:carboxymethylenebutenolidase